MTKNTSCELFNLSLRKNHINLSDYDYEADIVNRCLLREINSTELAVLEEILYSSIKISIKELSSNLDISIDLLSNILEKFLPTSLFTLNDYILHINKDKRKYFETQLSKFKDDFIPGMDFLQSLLKHVNIQHLPFWYQIPRSSNNIFNSLIEKYLQTPQIYQRYFIEFTSENDIITEIVKEIYKTNELCISAKEIQDKFSLSKESFEEIAIYLEYSLIAVVYYKYIDGSFEEMISPFQEWRDYLMLISETIATPSIQQQNEVVAYSSKEYAFIDGMTCILNLCEQENISVTFDLHSDGWIADEQSLNIITKSIQTSKDSVVYINKMINKLITIGIVVIEEASLKATQISIEWLNKSIENRAHIIFRHQHNFLSIEKHYPLSTKRTVMEIEKSMHSVVGLEWVYFDDFIKNSSIILNDSDKISLRRCGKLFAYMAPQHDDLQKQFIKYTVLEWFFESGIVQIGTHNDKQCFKLTSLGSNLFKSTK